MKRISLALLLVVVLLLTTFVSAATARQLFGPLYAADKLATYSSDAATGGLTAIPGSPFTTGTGGMTGWSMTPDGNFGVGSFLYSGLQPTSIAANGVVAPTQPQLIWPAGVGSYAVAVAPGGKFAYTANREYPAGANDAGLRAYAISGTGTLSEVAGSPYEGAQDFLDVAVTPDGSKIFATTGGAVYHSLIAADGTLGLFTPQAVAGAYFVAVSPDGRFAYIAGNDSGTNYLRVFSIAANGSLSQVGSSISVGSGVPRFPAVSPDGQFVYAFDANLDKISTIRIAPDGTPSVVPTPNDFIDPYSTGISPDGRFLYVSNGSADPSIQVAAIGADGRPGVFTKLVPFSPGEPSRLNFRPGQGTVASFKSAALSAALTMNFDGAGSTAFDGPVGTYNWNFGDGSTATGAAAGADHKFAKPGVYDVTLTAADDSGCSTQFNYNGKSTVCNGKSSAVKTIKVDTPPWITSLSVSPKTVGSRTKIKFKLTEKATVSFYAQKPLPGRTVGTSCKKQTSKNKKAKKCTRWVRASKTFRKSGKAGKTNSFRFAGKVGKKQLAKGSYRLYAVATDAAKGKGPEKTAKFKIR